MSFPFHEIVLARAPSSQQLHRQPPWPRPWLNCTFINCRSAAPRAVKSSSALPQSPPKKQVYKGAESMMITPQQILRIVFLQLRDFVGYSWVTTAAMATHSRLRSILFESLLISTLLFSLYFSSCNGTSRGLESMDRADLPSTEPTSLTNPMASSCGVRGSCQKSIVEQHLNRMHPNLMHPSSMNSAVAEEKISNPRMSDHDVRNSESERMMDTERLRDSRTVSEDQTMTNSDRMRDTEWMRDSEHRTRDLARMRDPAHSLSDSADEMSAMDRMMNSNNMRDSERMTHSERMRDSGRMMESNHHKYDSEMMRDSDRIRASEGRSDLENTRNADNMMDSAAHESGNHHDLEMMRDSDRIRASEGKRDLENAKNADNMMDSAAAERNIDLNDERKRGSEMMRDSDRNSASEERADLENTREANKMMQSAAAERHTDLKGENEHGASEMMDRTRNSNADQSRLEHMEKQHASTMRMSVADESKAGQMEMHLDESTMKPSSCHGGKCDTMRLNNDRNDSSQSKDSKATTDHSSTAASVSCSKMNAVDCDGAIDQGQLRGSKKMEVQSKGVSCKFNGADCRVTPADRETSNQKSIEHMRSTNSAGMSSCSDEHCRKSIVNMEEEAMAGMTNLERMHRTRKDGEIVTSPKWVKLERASTATHTKAMGSENMANTKMTRSDSPRMRNADAETMEVSRERHLGSIDAENRNSNMRGSEMAHSTSNHQFTAEINGQNSCAVGANCGSTTGIMHMSSRNAETMGHNDHESEMNHTGSKKSLEDRDLMMNEETVKDSQMMQRKSDQMTISGEMTSTSKMMRNPEEKKSDSLPIHDRN